MIHDGSYSVDVNRRIKVKDRLRFPLCDDAAAVLTEIEEEVSKTKEARFSLLYDISRAHKLVPIAEEDWGLQAFKLPGEEDKIYVHTRGNFRSRLRGLLLAANCSLHGETLPSAGWSGARSLPPAVRRRWVDCHCG